MWRGNIAVADVPSSGVSAVQAQQIGLRCFSARVYLCWLV